MFISKIFLAMILVLPSAWGLNEKQDTYPIQELLEYSIRVPDGNVELRVSSIFPSGCFQGNRVVPAIDKERLEILLLQFVDVVDEPCTDALVRREQGVEVYLPSKGEYTVIDFATRMELGTIKSSFEE